MVARALVATLLGIAIFARSSVAADEPHAWKAGVATVVITPSQPTWMAGYSSRTAPSDGALTDLFAKALVIEDATGARAVILTADLISIPLVLRDQVAQTVAERFQLDPAGLMMNCSHTHCGPVVKDDLELSVMYQLEPDQRQQVEAYFNELRDKLVQVIGAAIENLQPVTLGYSHARCGFAMNRRLPTPNGYQNSPYPDGPVDHAVPVLRVESPAGELIAVAFGYACHNTSTGLQQFNGDYAGYAQAELEKDHPGATALFVMGCGGDQNPYPRGKIEWAQAHGKSLANAVEAALLPAASPINGPLHVSLQHVDLQFAPVTRSQLLDRLKSTNVYQQRGAEALLREAETAGKVRDTYAYPIQVFQFGDDLTLVALAGEVVVDYSLRLKQELGGNPIWVAGYSNDVFAYVPSVRVLGEGGYEAADAMSYTSLPGPFLPTVEDLIVTRVREMVTSLRAAGAD